MLEVLDGGYYRQTQLSELIAEVDSWPREPTDEDIRCLAEKYGDTEEYVRYTFRARRWRQQKTWHQRAGRKGRRMKRTHTPWLSEEIELVGQWWRVWPDSRLAEELSQLPCNRERGVTRTAKQVARFRERRGWVKDFGVSPMEAEFIRAHYLEMSDADLAKALSEVIGRERSRRWVVRARIRMGLRKKGGGANAGNLEAA